MAKHSLQRFFTSPQFLYGALALLAAGLIGASVYGYLKLTDLSERIAQLSSETTALAASFATTTELLRASISETHSSLATALEAERENVSSIQVRLQEEVGSIAGTVNTLEKLSQTDSELLQKYSRVFFLNEHYVPEDVTEIAAQYKYFENRDYTIHSDVYPYLINMLNAAQSAGMELYVYSAYRPFDEQAALKGQYEVTYGAGTANQFSADQGYSEHQLGSTVDVITTGIGGTVEGFESTAEYQWMQNNAHRFGFTLSYPEGNSYYVFEPWHWRFVGVELATHLHNTGQHFYDLDQREIDKYLVNIFD